MNLLKKFLYRLRGEQTTEKLISMGMTVGANFGRLHEVILDLPIVRTRSFSIC